MLLKLIAALGLNDAKAHKCPEAECLSEDGSAPQPDDSAGQQGQVAEWVWFIFTASRFTMRTPMCCCALLPYCRRIESSCWIELC